MSEDRKEPESPPAAPAAESGESAEEEKNGTEPNSAALPTDLSGETPASSSAPSAAKEELPPIINVIGVKFRHAGKTYFFNAGALRYNIGETVIVETERGLALGRVVTPAMEMESSAFSDIKRVIRKANWSDLERDRKNKLREEEALKLCLLKIAEHKLNMKLVEVEYFHDASKAIFYFTAEQRVDFRELVKNLARQLHTRIEMRQIGVRDEAKMCGGLGPCGRPACCSTFLIEFSPVSVRMAKDQNLAMNPAKVSGLCGRLMCCLAYEHDLYAENLQGMPKKGKRMNSKYGPCRVIDLHILGRKVLCELESGKTMFLAPEELFPLEQAAAETAAEEMESEEAGLAEVNEEILESDDPRLLEQIMSQSSTFRPAAPSPRVPKDGGKPGAEQLGQSATPKTPPSVSPATERKGPPEPPPSPEGTSRLSPLQPPAGSRPFSKDKAGTPPPGSRPYQPGKSPAAGPNESKDASGSTPSSSPGSASGQTAASPGKKRRKKGRR